MSALGYGAWMFALLFLGWLAGIATVQIWDNRNYRRDQAETVDREAKLAQARANQERQLVAS